MWGFDNYYNSKDQNFQTFVKPYRFEDLKNVKDSTAQFPRLLAGTKAEERDKDFLSSKDSTHFIQ